MGILQRTIPLNHVRGKLSEKLNVSDGALLDAIKSVFEGNRLRWLQLTRAVWAILSIFIFVFLAKIISDRLAIMVFITLGAEMVIMNLLSWIAVKKSSSKGNEKKDTRFYSLITDLFSYLDNTRFIVGIVSCVFVYFFLYFILFTIFYFAIGGSIKFSSGVFFISAMALYAGFFYASWEKFRGMIYYKKIEKFVEEGKK